MARLVDGATTLAVLAGCITATAGPGLHTYNQQEACKTHHSAMSRSAGSMPASAATDSLLASADTPPTASKLRGEGCKAAGISVEPGKTVVQLSKQSGQQKPPAAAALPPPGTQGWPRPHVSCCTVCSRM